MKLILLRHGESQWNLENRFTGWRDVSLTKKGIEEATFSGEQLLKANIKISSVYTSLLNRATETTDIVTDIINFPKENIQYDWRLNERHYGALQGLNKSETAKKYGEDQVHIWRRSYDIPPPSLDKNDKRHPRFDNKFDDIQDPLPVGESLKNVIDRLHPFWIERYGEFHGEVANKIHSRGFFLPNYPELELSDIKIISINLRHLFVFLYKQGLFGQLSLLINRFQCQLQVLCLYQSELSH